MYCTMIYAPFQQKGWKATGTVPPAEKAGRTVPMVEFERVFFYNVPVRFCMRDPKAAMQTDPDL